MTDELKPCKICGKQPEQYETLSHVIIYCQSDEDDNPKDYHRLFVARSSEVEAVSAWNSLNQPYESGELQEWLKEKINERINFVDKQLAELRDIPDTSDDDQHLYILRSAMNWVLSLRKEEE